MTNDEWCVRKRHSSFVIRSHCVLFPKLSIFSTYLARAIIGFVRKCDNFSTRFPGKVLAGNESPPKPGGFLRFFVPSDEPFTKTVPERR